MARKPKIIENDIWFCGNIFFKSTRRRVNTEKKSATKLSQLKEKIKTCVQNKFHYIPAKMIIQERDTDVGIKN